MNHPKDTRKAPPRTAALIVRHSAAKVLVASRKNRSLPPLTDGDVVLQLLRRYAK